MKASRVLADVSPFPYPKNALGRNMSCFSASVAVFCQALGRLPLPFYLAGEPGLGVYFSDRGFEVRSSGRLSTAAMQDAGLCLSTIGLPSREATWDQIVAALDADEGVIVPVDTFYLPFSPFGYGAIHTEQDLAVYGYGVAASNLLVVDSLNQFQGPVDKPTFLDALEEDGAHSPEPVFRVFTLRFGSPVVPAVSLARKMLGLAARRILGFEPTPAPSRSGGRWVAGLEGLSELARAVQEFIPFPDSVQLETAMERLAVVAEKRMWLAELVPHAGFLGQAAEKVRAALWDGMQLWMVTRLWLGKCHVAPSQFNRDRLVQLLRKVTELEQAAAENIQAVLAEPAPTA